MATTTQIRDAIATVVKNVSGMAGCSSHPVDTVGSVPYAWLGDDTDTIMMGALEIHQHQLPLNVVVARKGLYGQELRAVEALEEAILAAFRANITLGGLVNLVSVEQKRQGQVLVAGEPWTGFSYLLVVKAKQATSLSG